MSNPDNDPVMYPDDCVDAISYDAGKNDEHAHAVEIVRLFIVWPPDCWCRGHIGGVHSNRCLAARAFCAEGVEP